MDPSQARKALLADVVPKFNVPTPDEMDSLLRRRDALIDECLSAGARAYQGHRHKIHIGELSPGCLTCAEGTWSAFFVNNLCHRSCWFCPRTQSVKNVFREGSTQAVIPRADDYPRFLRELGYRGVGFSGGDPFLSFPSFLEYLRKVRAALGGRVYLWAYTSGAPLTAEKLRAVADAGLDELRIDIAAVNYDLAPVREAVRHVPAVTVEIPMIPEDREKVFSLLPRLREAGVKHLNIHQLYGTLLNAKNLAARGYRFAAAPEEGGVIPVIDSEFAALELIRRALKEPAGLPIHYCSAIYKNVFQPRQTRARLAHHFTGRPPRRLRSVTPAGYVRELSVRAAPSKLRSLARRLGAEGRQDLVRFSRTKGTLVIHPALLLSKDLADVPVTVSYSFYFPAGRIPPGRRRHLRVGRTKHPVAEARAAKTVELRTPTEKWLFSDRFARTADEHPDAVRTGDAACFLQRFEGLEFIPANLPPSFRVAPHDFPRAGSGPRPCRK